MKNVNKQDNTELLPIDTGVKITDKKVHPELISEWSDRNYPLTPDNITFGSNKIVWWKGSCGHEWKASVKSRSSGEKCPICSGKRVVEGINDLANLKPELVKEWSDKNTLKPTEVTVGSHKRIIWKCKLGHEWEATVKSRTLNGTGCPYCSHNSILEGFNDLASQFLMWLLNGQIGTNRSQQWLQRFLIKKYGGSAARVTNGTH